MYIICADYIYIYIVGKKIKLSEMKEFESRCKVIPCCYQLCDEATEKFQSGIKPQIYEVFDKKRPAEGSDALEKTMASAIRFAESYGYLVPVICREVNDRGARSYIVSSWDVFFEQFLHWPAERRSAHEYIGENYPCNPFMDIDLKYPSTLSDEERTRHSGILLRKTFKMIKYVASELHRLFGVYTQYTLISSSERGTKYSKHILMKLRDGTMFSGNMVFGAVLKHIVASFADQSAPCFCGEPNAKNPRSFFYHCFCGGGTGNACGRAELLVDMALYAGPKQLRLLFSSKRNVTSFLLPQYKAKCITDFNMEDDDDDCIFSLINADSKKKVKKYFMDNIICAYDLHDNYPVNRLCHVDKVALAEGESWQSRRCYGLDTVPMSHEVSQGDANMELFERVAEELKSIYNLQALDRVYDPKFNAETGNLLYYCTSRVCEISRREHKSNHCYFRVNLVDKTVKRLCMDEECKAALKTHYDNIRGKKEVTTTPPGTTKEIPVKTLTNVNLPVVFYLNVQLWECIDEFLSKFE